MSEVLLKVVFLKRQMKRRIQLIVVTPSVARRAQAHVVSKTMINRRSVLEDEAVDHVQR